MKKQKKEVSASVRLKKGGVPELVTARADAWLVSREKGIFIAFCVLTALFSLLHFNARISEGGDDATYVKAGFDYSKHFTTYYFAFNAPGYPMFLSLPIKLFGLRLILLKTLSIFFYFFGFLFLYKALNKRVRAIILYPALFILAVNAYAQYYASQTYNEAFYMFFQGLFFYAFFQLTDKIEREGENIRLHWKNLLALGLLLFLLSFVKNVAIVALPAVLIYFLLNRQYITSAANLGAYLVIKIPFEVFKKAVWGSIDQYSGQGDILKLVDPYDKSKGYETTAGYFGRLFDNINIYLGKRFWEILGFLGKDPSVDDASKAFYSFLAKLLLVILLALFAFLLFRKKGNRPMLIITLYTSAMLMASFFALQARWDQPRIIIIFLPLLVLLFFQAFLLVFERGSVGPTLFLILIVVFCGSSLVSSLKRVGENLPALSKNLRGDPYAGYTPDWVNFLKMSRWCADNLPADALVASRKAPMSFIYGNGKDFYPVYRVIAYDTVTRQSNPDSVLAIFKRNKVTHVMLANIRIDPSRNSGQIINTMHNILIPVAQKYKDKVVLVHTEGESEPCELYEIKY